MKHTYTAGDKYNRLTLISPLDKDKHGSIWHCKCECGKDTYLVARRVKTGATKSCGCLSTETSGNRFRTHGMSGTKEHNAWNACRTRCYNKKSQDYPDYGGRGITVCDRWLESFENFYKDMGISPSKNHSLDRIDNSKGYGPDNCRWSNEKEQANNRRSVRYVMLDGLRVTCTMAEDSLGINRTAISSRVGKVGCTHQQALDFFAKKKNFTRALAWEKYKGDISSNILGMMGFAA